MAGGEPLSVTPPAHFDHTEVDAYNLCRRLESWDVWPLASLIQPGDTSEPSPDFVDVDMGPRLCARLLAQMLLQAPRSDGRRNVANEIFDCKSTDCAPELDLPTMEKLARLAQFYVEFFIRAFRNPKNITPKTNSHPSRPSFNFDATQIKQLLVQAPDDHDAERLLVLERQGYKCAVTGFYDRRTLELRREVIPDFKFPGPCLGLEFAHIISESSGTDLVNGRKRNYVAIAWADLSRFGSTNVVPNDFDTCAICRPGNSIVLQHDVHDAFDELRLWFEETKTPNHYRICGLDCALDYPLLPQTREITFTTTNALIDVPDPALIRLHTTCCRVAHLSGVAEYMDKIERDRYAVRVLAQDGQDGGLLAALLAGTGRTVSGHG